MSKIVAEFDTVTKELSITKNGEMVPNVSSVCMYMYGDKKGSIELTTSESDSDDGIYTYTRIYANDEGKDVEQSEVKGRAQSLAKILFNRN